MQAIGAGYLSDLAQARAVVRRSFALDTYTPDAPNADRWQQAYARFLTLRHRAATEENK